MIELLVALAISSFLLLGISQIYLDNQRNHLFQQSQSTNSEASRFVTLVLNDLLGKAAYRRAPDQGFDDAFPAKTAKGACKAFTKGSAVTATSTGLGLCLRYQPMVSGEMDCQGDATPSFDDSKPFQPAPTASLVTVALTYTPGNDLHEGTLTCKNIDGSSAPSELLAGIADFRIEYGIGTKAMHEKKLVDGSERFVEAGSWTSNEDTGPIRAVRYSILLASRTQQREGESAVLSSWLEKADATAKARLEAGDQNRIYQIASSTQTLRNLMP
ncbi:Tfp pilus assembly protein PilW [Stutzerimonas stutzeri]|jgi:type IV pilus assembly protein PilW|nr:Tfp pilus assembly protein PilW [Stutzerimonas stutzeri]CAB5555375.1 Tfp pilus assembly protein PilW [Stutzerimonas stutzeri]CAC9122879.1 Tfp pilus assembly protein PilW [Stutzerimonas stutzeri]